ncbi:DUF6599 family protein [Bacteroidota bacterium]
MMRLLLAIFLGAASISPAQKKNDFPVLCVEDFEGINIERTEYYDGNALWGLINGGADIYLEYGFDELAFQTVEWLEQHFRVEIYRMTDEEAAFGIFSVSRYKCDINDTLTNFICITPYQVQAAHGKYYISISNTTGSEEAMKLTIRLFEVILKKAGESKIVIPDLFASEILIPNMDKMKYIRGELGLMNAFPMWSDLFEGYSKYSFYILPVNNESGKIYLALIGFKNATDIDKFIEENSGGEFCIKRNNDTGLIFIQSDLQKSELNSLLNLEL